MPSTYTTNLGIEKIATGEQSGVWGTTTNTNLDLIDQAVNGIVSITLPAAGNSGSPNALNISDGSLSDGRNKFIEFVDGSDLGATAYVQLVPNDAEKIVIIRNSLSGSQSLIIFQGTYNASNDFEVANGKDVVLKFDGAGTGATVTQVFNDLSVAGITAAGSSTTAISRIQNTGLGATTFDGSGAGLELLAGVMDTTNKYTPAIKFGSTDPDFTTTNPKFGAAIIAEAVQAYSTDTAGGMSLEFLTSPTSPGTGSGLVERMRIDSSGNVGIGTSSPDNLLYLFISSTTQTASTDSQLVIERNDNSGLTILSGNTTSGHIFFGDSGDNDVGQITYNHNSNYMQFTVNASERMRIDSSGNVGIGTSSPSALMHTTGSGIGFKHTNGSVTLQLYSDGTNLNTIGDGPYFLGTSNANDTIFKTNNTERMRLDTSGNLKFDSGYGSVVTAYGCRAWVNFNGTGTVAIRDSGNVSSITDLGTGQYGVNLTTAMPDANYAAVFSAYGNSARNTTTASISSSSLTVVRVYTDSTSSFADAITASFAIIR